MSQIFDVIVVGLGPGGETLAGELADSGLRVAGIERRLVGGVCPYWGCIPSKMMVHAAADPAESHNWAQVAQRIRDEATDDWDDSAAASRLRDKGVTIIRGDAQLTGSHTVTVAHDEYRAERAIVLNTGTEPAIPPIDGLADTPYWTNKHAIETTTVPHSLMVIGGGALGVEFAQIFARFGSQVTVIETADRLLAAEEPEASSLLADVFTGEQIDVVTSATVQRVEYGDNTFTVYLKTGEPLTATNLLLATGRRADLRHLGVASIGIDDEASHIPTDENMRVVPGVWAIGDVTGKGAFTHVSMYQAAIAAADILGRPHASANYQAVPRVTFTDPEIGSVGMTEEAARHQGIPVACAVTDLAHSSRGFIYGGNHVGLIKLVLDTQRQVLVGATSAGPMGGEVLSMLVLAVHAQVPLPLLQHMMYAYPTFHRAVHDAVSQLSQAA